MRSTLHRMPKCLLLVCDDAGFASVDRGIRTLADETGLQLCAEYLIEQDGAAMRAKEMSRHPSVSIGMHFELPGISDADRVGLSRDLRTRGTVLGDQADIREGAIAGARRQLERFREALGRDPAHVSTHGDFNVNLDGRVQPWWLELMDELFAGDVPPMQWKHPVVRHNKYSWNIDATKREPLTPGQFEEELRRQESDIVEFVMHPALPKPGDASLAMLFTAEMRVRDLRSAIDLLQSDCVKRAGFGIVPVSRVA